MQIRIFFLVLSFSVALFSVSAEDEPLQITIGTGFDFSFYNTAISSETVSKNSNDYFMGFNSFFGITKYATVRLGYQFGLEKETIKIISNTPLFSNEDTISNSMRKLTIGAEIKYPFDMKRSSLTIAPTLGIEWHRYYHYLSANINGFDLSSSHVIEKIYSPLYLTVGFSVDFLFDDNFFLRSETRLGYSLNTDLLPDGFSVSLGHNTMLFNAGLSAGCVF